MKSIKTTTAKQLTAEIRNAFYSGAGGSGVKVTCENLAASRRLKLGVTCGRGGIDCRRWGFSEILGHEAYHCGIARPEIGDLLVLQCGQVG